MSKSVLGSKIFQEKRSFAGILNYFPLTTPQFLPLQHFFFHFSHLQYLAILLSIQITALSPTPKTALAYFIKQAVEILTLKNVFQDNYTNLVYSVLLICIWAYFLFFLFILGILAFRALTKIQLIPLPRYLLDKLFQSHLTILFWIINMILLAPLGQKTEDKVIAIGLESGHVGLILPNLFSLLFNYIMGAILSIFCTEPFQGTSMYTTHTSLPQVPIFLMKAVLAPLLVLYENNNKQLGISLAVIGLVFCVLEVFILLKNMPYYSPTVMKFALSWSFVALWISLLNIFIVPFFTSPPKDQINGVIFTNVLLLPCCIKLSIILFNRIMKSSMATPLNTLTSDDLIFKKLLGFSVLIQNMKITLNTDAKLNEYEAYFLGDLAQHSDKCKDKGCICHLISSKQELQQNFREIKDLKEGMDIYKHKRICEILSIAIDNIKDNHKLKLAYATIILQGENARTSSALTYLYAIKNESASFTTRIHKHILLRIVQVNLTKFFVSRQEGVLNLKNFIDFHLAETYFQNLLLSNTKKYNDFWTSFRQPQCKMTELFEKSQAIEKESEKIENLWNIYVNKYPQFYYSTGENYCNYLRLVRNSPFYANKIYKKYLWKLRSTHTEALKTPYITQANLNLPDTITFYVSMSREKIGRIQYSSSNTDTLLGFTSEELIGKSINLLMSPLLSRDHDQLLLNHLQQTKSLNGKNYYSISSYVKDKKGYFLPASTYTAIFPYVQSELTYIGMLRINEPENEHIVVTENGYIDGFTQGIGKALGLSTTKPNYISEICSEFFQSMKKKSLKLANVVLEAMSVSEEIIARRDSSQFKGKSLTLSNFLFSKKEEELLLEEMNWKTMNFLRQDPHNERIREYVPYEVKVTPKTFIKKNFYILEIKPLSFTDNFYSYPNIINKGKSKILDSDEEDMNIPAERRNFIRSTFCSQGKVFSSRFQAETDSGFISSKNNRRSQRIGTSEGVFSPKGQRTEASHRALIESEENVLEIPQDTTLSKHVLRGITLKVNKLKEDGEDSSDLHNTLGINNHNKGNQNTQFSDKASSVTSTGANSKIEQVVYSVPKNPRIKLLIISTVVFWALCIGLLIAFVSRGSHSLKLIEGNIDILHLSDLRLSQIVFIHRSSEQITLLRTGYFLDSRYEHYYYPSMKLGLPPSLLVYQETLNAYNYELRNALNQTEYSLLREINEWTLPVILENSQVTDKNTFDAVTEIVMRSIVIGNTPEVFTQEDDNVDFIMTNTMNHLLVISENIDSIIIEDNEVKFNNLKKLSLIFFFLVFLLGILLLLALASQQRKFIQNRNKFLELFLRIDDDEIVSALNKISAFEVFLTQEKTKFGKLKTRNMSFLSKKEDLSHAKLKNTRTQKREANMKNINKIQTIIFGLGFILFLLFLTPFLDTLILILNQTSIIRNKISTLFEVSNSLYEVLLLSVSFYQYIRTDGDSLLRNKPIGEEWERLYKKIADSQSFLLKLLIANQREKTCNQAIIDTLDTLINGGLCTAPGFESIAPLCSLYPDGLVSKGIQGINSYTLYTLRNLKDEYDFSQKTFDDAFRVFSHDELIDLELVLSSHQQLAYTLLFDTLQGCTVEEIDQVRESLSIRLGIYVTIMTLLSSLFLISLVKKIELERVGWRKIFRQIPMEVIVKSKILKHYLAKEVGLSIQI